MAKAERNINKDKCVDRFRLDEECELQPSLVNYWSKRVSDLKYERDNLKVQLKEEEGKVKIAIFTGNYPLPKDKKGVVLKVTNPIIEAIVDTDEKIIVLREDLNNAEADLSDALADEKTIEARGFSLSNLKDLYTKEYYAPINTDDRRGTRGNMKSEAIANDLNERSRNRNQED